MIARLLLKRHFCQPNQISSLLRKFWEDRKSGVPEVKAFENRLQEVHKLSEREIDAFYSACISMSKTSNIPLFLKSQGLLTKLPAMHIIVNTHHVVHTLKNFQDKQKLL